MNTQPTLIMLSGLLCDDFVWQDVAQHLKPIVNPLIFAFSGYDTIPSMAEYVLKMSPPNFFLAGHSMGGRVALEIFRLAPQRVERLALLNTGVHPKREGETASRQKLVELAEKQGMEALAKAWLPPMVGPRQRENKTLMKQLNSMVANYSLNNYKKQISALINRPNAEAILQSIQVPTLLLSGTEDTWSPLSQHEEIQQAIRQSKLIALPSTGHMSTVEEPLLVAEAFKEWINWPKH